MEGVTEPCFRDLLLECNPPEHLGGAFTEFARVVKLPLPRRVLRAHLGPHRGERPIGLQLMGADLEALGETARRAEEIGAPLVDVNFGCPAKGALRGCAGSAVLAEPARLERILRAVGSALERSLLTAKIRAGIDDTVRLTELAQAAEEGGAAMLTVHCRTRSEGYQPEVDWSRLTRAVESVEIPVCGNGGVLVHADLERMRRETGCALVMVGRAALGDPWIFSGAEVGASEAARFLLDYAEALHARYAASASRIAGRLKQLLRCWRAGGLVGEDPRPWLAERDPARLLERLRALAGA
jgi:tRNA-dihydrouridine synthase